ncbi:MAG: DUF427 domain-containing protein [Rubrivivax sp.]
MKGADRPGWLQAARDHWRWRGNGRPPFAVEPGPGQVSVWDFPRPPTVEPDTREVVVRWGRLEVARSCRAVKVLETAHPPSWYLPWSDLDRRCFEPTAGGSFCEWKGPAHYFDLVDRNLLRERRLAAVAWSYPKPLAGAEALADCVSMYPAVLKITVDGAPVRQQPGGFYGGWITPELVGPFKGDPGSEGW